MFNPAKDNLKNMEDARLASDISRATMDLARVLDQVLSCAFDGVGVAHNVSSSRDGWPVGPIITAAA